MSRLLRENKSFCLYFDYLEEKKGGFCMREKVVLVENNGGFKVEGSGCAKNCATTRKSTRRMDNSGPFLVDLLHCHSLSIPIILHT
jgi:hypothetical protein